MKTYKVTPQPYDISHLYLDESEKVRDILQNVAMILCTPLGSVPHYRDFGLDWSFIDRPENIARPMLVMAVREAIQRHEPRVEVLDVSIKHGDFSRLVPTVELRILGGEDDGN